MDLGGGSVLPSSAQASLYERDNRRQYCPVELWLASFSTTISPDEAAQTSPAVLQAVLNRTSRSRLHSHSFTVFSLGATEETISSSTAYIMGLVNLLLAAPQCIPFNKRVEIFRDSSNPTKRDWDSTYQSNMAIVFPLKYLSPPLLSVALTR